MEYDTIAMRSTGRGFAACGDHLNIALETLVGSIVKIRNVRVDDIYSCGCGDSAIWFLMEVTPVAT